jgi:hypothetical protein
LPSFGIVGAAWAYFGAAAFVPFIFWWAEKKYLHITGQFKFYVTLYSKVILTSVLFYVVAHYGIAPYVYNRTILIFIGPLVVIGYFVLYRLLGFFNNEDWQLFMAFWQTAKVRMGLTKI